MWAVRIASFLYHKFENIKIDKSLEKKLQKTPQRNCKGLPTVFAPLVPSIELFLDIPRERVIFVDNPGQLKDIKWYGDYAGLDSEWKSNILRFDDNKPAILQIALEDVIYIFDLFELNLVPEFNELLERLFQSEIVKLGVSFDGDSNNMKRHYPQLSSFSKDMKNYIDICKAYGKIFKKSPGGLAGACELLLGKPLSKFEQMSNWENRPLRESQVHYAALDAYIQIVLWKKMQTETSKPLSSFLNSKRKFYKGDPGCDHCSSKLHQTASCPYGDRCKICFHHGHNPNNCPN